ncbi:hypothetical protein EW026_g2881 [Hermanssonia centrifuga]|uniref:EF-hand domain-containing protein n=1 Tax=Hermanssonia centrifuga TaxID=98765 RepID=A0A4S4KLT8_9APHY|nr:hypothetical protein EW026_g2881 [Hermanssonia centrifuga]
MLTGAIFLHDAFTYTDKHIDGVPVAPLALHPERGGPKNLPVVKSYLSDLEDSEQSELCEKPHLVIVGGGWGAIGVINTLKTGDYHVTVVSPETYTTFTPLLPSEMYDLCQEDIMNYYPKMCRQDVSITVIQSREHILNTYSEAISQYAEKKFMHDGVGLITNARVAAVTPTSVIYTKKGADGKPESHEIPTNFVLWSTGIAMNPFVARVSSLLPNQVHRKAIEVDAHLRVKGAPMGEVYAIGDASTIETSIVSHLLDLVDESDKNKDGKIDFEEWEDMVQKIKKRIPMSEEHLSRVRELFDLYDSDADNSLNLNELAVLLQEIGHKITALPATAQVAAQQGKYLGRKLSKVARQRSVLAANGLTTEAGVDEAVSSPFRYLHLGSLAYIGNAAVFDLGKYSFMGGLAAMYAWRSVYWSEQVSSRTRALLMIDWIVRGVWGRDLSRL